MAAYDFVMGTPADMDAVRQLIDGRITWLEERGIDQWPREAYWQCYSEEYFLDKACTGRLFLLRSENASVGVVVLREEDPFWDDDGTACYIHNLATDPAFPGAGAVIVGHCERIAAERGKAWLRLDCAQDNRRLNAYYQGLGYAYAGKLYEEDYIGNKYQKFLGGCL